MEAFMKSAVLSLCSAVTLFAPLSAATATWQGGGGNSLWSNVANWMGGTPPVAGAGDTAVFPSVSSDYMPDNDIANLGLAALNVGSNTNSYMLISSSSTAVTMASGATIGINPTGTVLTQTFNLPIQMNGPTGVTFDSTHAAFGSIGLFQQTISGSGGVNIVGAVASAVQFQAANLYTGTTFLGTNGGLTISNDSNLGNAADPLQINGGILTIEGSFTTGRSFLISGAADISVSGSFVFTHDNTNNILNNSAGNIDVSDTGTFALTGPNINTYAGSYQVDLGTLQGTTNTINTNINTLSTTASVVFAQGFNGTYTNVISGSGSVTKQQAGILTFNQAQSYTNGTTIAGGTLALTGSGALFAMGSVNLSSSSAIFDISAIAATSTMIGPITGVAGSEVQLGSKFLATLINATTTFAGNLLDGGNNGGLIKNGTGTFILTGTNNYLGGNTVNGGTLQGDTNSIKGNVSLLANTNVIFNQNTDGVYPSQISGPGTVTKIGSALLNMTGASNYTGATTVSTGTLAINGSITSPVTVASGATLKGTGTITGNTQISGTLMPGNSIGTINIVGNVTFNAGSTFVVELNPTQASLLNITGSLTIQPDTLQIFPFSGNYPPGMLYTIVTTTGPITGTFTNVVNNSATLQFTVLYFPNQIDLMLQRLSFSTVVTKGNPGSAAKSLDNVTPAPGTDLAFVFSQLNTLNLPQLYQAFNQMQPSLTLGLALAQQNNFNLIETTLRKRTNALHTLRCSKDNLCQEVETPHQKEEKRNYFKSGPKREPEKQPTILVCKEQDRWRVWGDASLDFYHQHRQNQNVGFKSDTALGAAGLDYQFDSNIYLGLLGAYTYTDVHWSHALAKGNINSYYGGLYSSWLNDYFYVNLSAIGAYNSYGHSRKIKFADIDRHAQARHGGSSVDSHLDLGLTFPANQKFQFGPYGEVDFIYQHQKKYHEHAAKSLNLHVHKYNATMLRSELGLQGRYCIAVKPGFLVPSANLSWVREVRFQGKHLQARFSNEEAEGQAPRPFIVYGIYPNRNLIAPGASLSGIFLDERLTASVTYQGQFGHKVNDNAVNLTLVWAF
jgi:autotransporter-associated beta strand protein